MIVLGISAHFHDAAVCLVKDGVVVAAAEEERFTRIKHDAAIPALATAWCLRQAGLCAADVDLVAWYEDPEKKLSRQLAMGLPAVPPPTHRPLDPRRAERDIREVLGLTAPIVVLGHHESHAAAAFYASGFQSAAILNVDGVGEWDTLSAGRGEGRFIEILKRVEFPHSIGLLYSTITAFLGFEVNEGEYKVMGLAPYGKPVHVDKLRQLVRRADGFDLELDLKYFSFMRGRKMYSPHLVALLDELPRPAESALTPFAKDLAASLQVLLEELLFAKVKALHDLVGGDHLCMAGGVALNCVANGKIKRDGPFRHLSVQPAAGDAGSAIGAALAASAAHDDVTLQPRTVASRRQDPPFAPIRHVYLGPKYRTDEVERAINARQLNAVRIDDDDAFIEAVVDRLAAGAIVGFFQGAMEFGPRALGARSILADPRGAHMRDKINALVKKREAFRPFAPAVLAEHAAAHFDLDHPSPFMLETCQVTSPLSLPAITHIDGSARVQTVHDDLHPRFAKLLRRFFARTGCPILLNTSFNVRGEPIVHSPVDAVVCLLRASLDTLAIENILVDRDAVPADIVARVGGTRPSSRAAGEANVYTFF